LLTEEQKKKYDQMDRRQDSSRGAAPLYKVWVLVPEGKPVPVDISTGISDGSNTEVISGALKEGQEVIIEATTGNSKSGSASQATQPSMKGFR
jgi:multidrug efflux pump subunit AcrA (membrane-fusion protein)